MLLYLRPAVLQRAGAVEDGVLGGAAAVGAEVAHALELVTGDAIFPLSTFHFPLSKRRLTLGGDHTQAVGVEVLKEGVAFFHIVGGLDGEETVEEAHLGVDGVLRTDPVDGALHLAAVGGVAAARGGVVGAVDAGDVALVCAVTK